MATCGYCGTTIVFGGAKSGNHRFCNQTCLQKGSLLLVADRIPEADVRRMVREVHHGLCPKCGGPGPVDVHTSHRVWSALVLTSWSSRPQISCRGCGSKAKVLDAVISGVFGWWGFPWGFVMTPIQVGRNVFGLFGSPPPGPSDKLDRMLRLGMASSLAAQGAQLPAGPATSAKPADPVPGFDPPGAS